MSGCVYNIEMRRLVELMLAELLNKHFDTLVGPIDDMQKSKRMFFNLSYRCGQNWVFYYISKIVFGLVWDGLIY